MFKRSLLLVLLVSVVVGNSAYAAGWEPCCRPGTFVQKINGKPIGAWFGVQQYAQPTNYTCGATTIAMQMMWETHKKGNALRYDTMWIHNYVNTDGPQTGLSTDEMKAGIKKVINLFNNGKTWNKKIHAIMVEGSGSDTKSAISVIAKTMLANDSPVVLYGNVKNSPDAGGHYYLATGMLNCPKGICNADYIGLFINDSVYGSRANFTFPGVVANAIPPRFYINHKDLETYWKKTGHWNPWYRNHMFLANDSFFI